jgi:DNA-binding response OmpR family regulator
VRDRRILIIEDEHDIAELIRLYLSDIYADVQVATSGHEGLLRAENQNWDLIVLDLRLPGIDGLEICRRLRERSDYTPILMLTAKSRELDRVLGLDCGADDYLTKPFSLLELSARIKAILRRVSALAKRNAGPQEQVVQRGQLELDVDKRQVTVAGHPVKLTAKEFDLLLHFATHPGRVYRRSQLLDEIWGYGHDGYEHTVNSHINRLRAKIERDPGNPEHIVTVWGVGYRFDDSSAG